MMLIAAQLVTAPHKKAPAYLVRAFLCGKERMESNHRYHPWAAGVEPTICGLEHFSVTDTPLFMVKRHFWLTL
jgi:hypothetical protein